MKKGMNNMSDLITTLLVFLIVTPIVPIIIVVSRGNFDMAMFFLLGIYPLVTLGIYIPLVRGEASTVVEKLKGLMLSMVFAGPITGLTYSLISAIYYNQINWKGLLYSVMSIAAILGVIFLITEWSNTRGRK